MSCCSRRSRGVGAILAAVFMLLILVLGFSVFMVIQAQMGEFQESVETMNTLAWERGQESGFINDILSNVITDDPLDPDYLKLNLTVTNDGFIGFRLVYMGIENLTDSGFVYLVVNDPASVNPGETVSGIVSSKPLALGWDSPDQRFLITFVTERGNTILVGLEGGVFGAPGGGEGEGTGHGFPFTLNLEMTPRFYKQIPGSSNNEIYIFGANLANATMTVQNLTLRVEDYGADFDPDSFGGDPDVAVIVRTEDVNGNVVESCTNVPLSKSSVGNVDTYVLEFPGGSCTISTLDPDLTLYVQIDGSQATGDSKYALLRLFVAGTVSLGGPDIEITTNVAAITIQG